MTTTNTTANLTRNQAARAAISTFRATMALTGAERLAALATERAEREEQGTQGYMPRRR